MGNRKHRQEGNSQNANDWDDGMSIEQATPSAEDAVRQLDLDAADAIARQLKSTYGKLLSEPVPDKFLDLLEKLGSDKAQAEKSPTDKG